jgi:hypothetical protein
MSRTHHRTDPDVARKRRALRIATNSIVGAWTWNERLAGEKVRSFRRHLLGLEGVAWWEAVTNVRPWLPGRRR